MMIDKRLINTVADSKKWIGITVLWNWVALIGGIISAVVFSYMLQVAYFNELGPLSAVIWGIVLIAALALRAFAGKNRCRPLILPVPKSNMSYVASSIVNWLPCRLIK